MGEPGLLVDSRVVDHSNHASSSMWVTWGHIDLVTYFLCDLHLLMFDLDLGTYVLVIPLAICPWSWPWPWDICPCYTFGDMSLVVTLTLTLECMSLVYLGTYVLGKPWEICPWPWPWPWPWNICPWNTLGDMSLDMTMALEVDTHTPLWN
jgi:hypothetical protein